MMKRKIISRILAALMVVALAACGSPDAVEEIPTPEVEDTPTPTPTESVYEVPQETCMSIQHELYEYFHGFDENSVVSVSDCAGALDIFLCYEGMVLRVPFPDYANALSVQSKELAAEYGEEIYRITVQFTGGQGKSITWETYDGISGNLVDTYEDAIDLSNQTIQDLVDRYGCMDWFYQLSEPEISTPDVSDDVPDNEKDTLPIGPVGGNGFTSLDSTIYLLSSMSDGSVVYDPEANCIIEILPVDGFIQAFLTAYSNDSESSVERWETTKSNYCSLDNSTRDLINQMCDVEVDTMFALVDNEQEYGYVMLIQNGEVTYSLIDDFIDLMP